MYVFICVRVCVCPRVGICDVSGHAQKTEEDIGFLGEGIRDIGGGGGIRLLTWMLDLNSGLHCSKPPGPSHPTPTPTLPDFVMNEELTQILFGLLASASQVNEVIHSNL